MAKATDKTKLLRTMAKAVRSAGYNNIAEEISEDKNVRKNVKLFLRMYKSTMYGKFHEIHRDKAGKIINVDKKGKISPKYKKQYDKVEKVMLNALRVYERWYHG